MRAVLLIGLFLAAAACLSPAKAVDCARGFRFSGSGACTPIEIPQNARLNDEGYGWTCNWGYRRAGNECIFVDVPRNATLSSFGDFWMCDHAYYEMHGVCLPEDGTHRAKPALRIPGFMDEPPARGAMPRRSPSERSEFLTRLNVLSVVVAGVITWGIFFLLREPPANNTRNYTTKYIPRARGSSTLAIWRPFGHRIDALTGGVIAGAASQCRNCRAWYQAESAATLRRENGARCISCGRTALTSTAG